MKPQSEYTMADLDKIAEALGKYHEALAASFEPFFAALPPSPPLTPWQRFRFAVSDFKETMIVGMRHCWLYVCVLWLGIAIGGFAGWIEWGMR